MIYDINSNILQSAYDVNGDALQSAYDVDEVEVYSAGPPTLKVMTYNVGSWYIGSTSIVPDDKDAEYYALQNGILSAHSDVDVLCINEYRADFSNLRTAYSVLHPYYDYIHAKVDGVYWGRAICTKKSLNSYTENYYTNDSRRYYDKTYITVGGKNIAIITTHLGTTQSERTPQIAELVPYLQNEDYFICCGDFNAWGATELDPFRNAGFHLANNSTFGNLITYSSGTTEEGGGAIDNIITSSNITIKAVTRDMTKFNDSIVDTVDHVPLIATLEIGDAVA